MEREDEQWTGNEGRAPNGRERSGKGFRIKKMETVGSDNDDISEDPLGWRPLSEQLRVSRLRGVGMKRGKIGRKVPVASRRENGMNLGAHGLGTRPGRACVEEKQNSRTKMHAVVSAEERHGQPTHHHDESTPSLMESMGAPPKLRRGRRTHSRARQLPSGVSNRIGEYLKTIRRTSPPGRKKGESIEDQCRVSRI